MKEKISLRLTVLSIFLFVTGLTAAVALSMHYVFSQQLAKEAANTQFVQIAEQIEYRAKSLERDSMGLVRTLIESPKTDFPVLEQGDHPIIPLMADLLSDAKELYSTHVGYADGSYIQLTNLDVSEDMRQRLQAAPSDRWLETRVIPSADGNKFIKRYLDSQLTLRLRLDTSINYDPRNRPWYKLATDDAIIKIPPYLVTLINESGLTYAQSKNAQTVVGANLVLSLVSSFLDSQMLAQSNQAFMFSGNGVVTEYWDKQQTEARTTRAHIELTDEERLYIQQNPLVKVANEMDYPPFDFSVSGEPKGYSMDLVRILAEMLGLELRFTNGLKFEHLYQAFKEGELDVMASMRRDQEREKIARFSQPTVPSNIVVASHTRAKDNFHNIRQLAGKRIAIVKDYVVSDYLVETYPHYQYLEVTTPLAALFAINQGKADVLVEMGAVVNYLRKYYFLDDIKVSAKMAEFNDIEQVSLHLLFHNNQPQLHNLFSKALAQVTNADKTRLQEKWLTFTDKPSIIAPDHSLALGQLPSPEFLEIAQKKGLHGQINSVTINQNAFYAYVVPLRDPVAGQAAEFLGLLVSEHEFVDPYLNKVKVAVFVTFLALLTFIPLILFTVHLINDPIRRLVDENNKVVKRRFNDVIAVKSQIREIHDLSGSMVSMADSIQAYQASQKALLDSFIKLIARAIDQKSSHTGGHCERVPHLAIMLAEAASSSQEPPFCDFEFSNQDQWREFKIAAWLHDCGKVTTPEHIVEKGSKLEALYNRIHEVRMRFEVLWRDAEITFWRNVSKTPEAKPKLKEQLDAQLRIIKEDFAFVAACNIGGESMCPEDVERLQKIAKQRWLRNLDDQLGLSPEEEQRMGQMKRSLPEYETVLADKTQHITARDTLNRRANSSYNITVPKNLQNLGELYNLTIPKGTLTPEDRYIINEHIVTTIEMLETLPLPDELKNIPEYAGGHHETMKGTGFPKGLHKEQLSLPARMMAIADIFEALTASDRPYKKAKSLKQSLDIMHKMSEEEHIDKDLFELFIRDKIFLKYAAQFLANEQIDDVDTAQYLT